MPLNSVVLPVALTEIGRLQRVKRPIETLVHHHRSAVENKEKEGNYVDGISWRYSYLTFCLILALTFNIIDTIIVIIVIIILCIFGLWDDVDYVVQVYEMRETGKKE